MQKIHTHSSVFLGALIVLGAFAGQGRNDQGRGNLDLGNLPTGNVILEGNGPFSLENVNSAVEKLNAVNLEETSLYTFELSGQSSVNLKFDRDGGTDGTFVTRNSAANPNTEIAYYNLARILGVDKIVRGAIPYSLKSNAISVFRQLINNTPLRGTRLNNARAILQATSQNPNELKGCIKEKKKGKTVAINSLVDLENNKPALSHQLFKDLNAANPMPNEGVYQFREGYQGSRTKIAKQYSVLMTLDAFFGQWDRYSGDNVVFRIVNEETKEVEVYSTDNGGADFWNTTKWTEKQLSWFSRFDRNSIEQIKGIYSFLSGRATSLHSERLGKTWTDPKEFVKDLGLYYEKRPEQYVSELTKNLEVLLSAVERSYARYGEASFFN